MNGNIITIAWTNDERNDDPTYYQVRQKVETTSEWVESTFDETGNKMQATIQKLRYDTTYQFQVRAVYWDSKMSVYSKPSNTIVSGHSPAADILPLCTAITGKRLNPQQYELPVFEDEHLRDRKNRIRRSIVGKYTLYHINILEKCISCFFILSISFRI